MTLISATMCVCVCPILTTWKSPYLFFRLHIALNLVCFTTSTSSKKGAYMCADQRHQFRRSPSSFNSVKNLKIT